jgi:hypothetical protein
VSLSPTTGAVPSIVDRLVSLGFESRLVANPIGGAEPVTVQLTRNQIHELRVNVGDRVYLRALPASGDFSRVRIPGPVASRAT